MASSGDPTVKYEATVVTGLEEIAAEECKEKLSGENKSVTTEQGRVIITDITNPIDDLLSLKSVDNVYVLIYKTKYDKIPKDDKEFLKTELTSLVEKCDWRRGISTWIRAFNHTKYNLDEILSTEPIPDKKPSFRVTCNRSGEHSFTSNEAASIFGGAINDIYHWPVTMKNFDIEVILNIRETRVSASIALTTQSLHHRNLVSYGPTSLRSTIAYNMLRLAKIKTGDVVCDPMCGAGSIPIESCVNWPNAFNVSGDNHPLAVEKALNNWQSSINASGRSSSSRMLDILQFDVTSLPYRNESIDIFVSDLPFGVRMGSKYKNKTLYPALLTEMARCARPNYARAVLLTQDQRGINQAFVKGAIPKYWKLFNAVFVKIGGLCAYIYCLKRSAVPYTND